MPGKPASIKLYRQLPNEVLVMNTKKYDQNCVFCKIIAHEIPATRIAENDDVLVIKDIAPKAPLHYLVIPKIHVSDIVSAVNEQLTIFVPFMSMVEQIAQSKEGSKSFRLVFNNGRESGQSVFHLHAHFLAGKQMHDL